ncbi:MAG: hypothetical protein GY757_54620, partial [bacterium]|nr:hypothetical protein [bacterium]
KKGTLAREEFYKQGERIKAKWYYPDGLLSDHREYRKGKKHGRWLHIDKTGKLVLDESFKNDKPVKK